MLHFYTEAVASSPKTTEPTFRLCDRYSLICRTLQGDVNDVTDRLKGKTRYLVSVRKKKTQTPVLHKAVYFLLQSSTIIETKVLERPHYFEYENRAHDIVSTL